MVLRGTIKYFKNMFNGEEEDFVYKMGINHNIELLEYFFYQFQKSSEVVVSSANVCYLCAVNNLMFTVPKQSKSSCQ